MPFDSGNKLCFRQYRFFIEGLLVHFLFRLQMVFILFRFNLVNLQSTIELNCNEEDDNLAMIRGEEKKKKSKGQMPQTE